MIILSILGVSCKLDSTALANSVATVTVPGLSLIDASGEEVKQVHEGEQVSIQTLVSNNIENDQQSVIIIEVRGGSGITEYLAWQSIKIKAYSNYTFETSWIAEKGCQGALPECSTNYQVRSFAVTDFVNPQLLGGVTTLEGITILAGTKQGTNLYRLMLDDKEYVIEYSMLSGFINQIQADPLLGVMTLQLDRVGSDTELTINLSKDLMDVIFMVGTIIMPSGEVIEYAPEIAVDTLFVQPISVEEREDGTTWTIPVQQGTEEVEFFVSMLL